MMVSMKLVGRALVVVGCFTAGPALGNGAFPDSQAVITPSDRPSEILLATNFGLITSTDDGRSWTWSCEQDPNGMRNLYQLGPSPRHRLFARDSGGLVFTDDAGCHWAGATGDLADSVISDAFPDPVAADRILAVAAPRGGTDGVYRVLESSDAGKTFSTVVYTAAPGDAVSGVEIARADPSVIYLIILKGFDLAPALALSTDRGATWQHHDLSAALGTGSVLLVAVDRQDPRRVFLQVNHPGSNVLAVVDGGGTVISTPLHLDGGFMSGFLQTAGGAILISGLVGADAVLYRSRDDAASFEAVSGPPKLWGLSERAGTIFGAARTGSPFAIAKSVDEGSTWQPFMRYEEVKSIAGCVQAACEDVCLSQAAVHLWPREMCLPPTSVPQSTDGSVGADGSSDAAIDEPGRKVTAGNDEERPTGCACALSGLPRGTEWDWGMPAVVAWLVTTVRSRRRPPRSRGERRDG